MRHLRHSASFVVSPSPCQLVKDRVRASTLYLSKFVDSSKRYTYTYTNRTSACQYQASSRDYPTFPASGWFSYFRAQEVNSRIFAYQNPISLDRSPPFQHQRMSPDSLI
ncbi:hypothetical protein EV356DRAFT_160569 [Viridothelium virens]|uniref:Uncharacterized protein n=1 Tax=Viridothelium virens TaxID=1048519 RepID=A0A6A6H993_VIRVR|nr:hypothetical protein EV356DRAFT_160569 [Viridothelium virens]